MVQVMSDGDGTLQVMSQVVETNSYNVTQSMKCNVGICFNNLTHWKYN